ncbi:MAG: PEP-utilizing enzyme [Flavobacterium sp.]|nr:PEP-utilizing enzyme [Flavobacterium sp.]
MSQKFISPYDYKAPEGAEGWKELYPYYMVFQDNLKETEESKFFFCDSQHWPQVFKPFDAITVEFAVKCLSQYNTRQWIIPPANGIDFKIHNGYCYMSPVGVAPELIGDRVPQFMERAGFYFQNWESLLANWHVKVKGVIDEMEAIKFEKLPEVIDIEWVKNGIGLDPTYHMIQNYDKLIDLCYKTWMYHFEFLNLGYAAYLDFFGFCKETFPGIPDLSIAKMVQGVESDLFRPDEELRKLSKLAIELKIVDVITKNKIDEALVILAKSDAGKQWVAAWEAAKYPWFNFTTGNGFYSTDKYWIEHLEIPFGYIQDYVVRLDSGENIDRPTEAIHAERDRIIEEYRDSIHGEEAQAAFDGKLGLARTVFPYVENHNFYIEHWAMCVFWRKMRELSAVFVEAGFFDDIFDMFYFRREEIHQLLFDYGRGWAMGVPSIGPDYLPTEIARRKKIIDALSTQAPKPAFNEPPAVVTEPFTIMLWGITTESVQGWLNSGETTDHLKGMAASPGKVEGIARVINNPDDLGQLQFGEILVTRVTAPSWAPVFGKIKATVTDIGGMMSHAAIVCREYGLPAVTGTGSASTRIKTGDRIQVNGSTGEVIILEEA